MILPDANLLLHSYNTGSRFHSRCAAWWSRCLTGRETVAFCPSVLFAFLRISTGTRAFSSPLSMDEAFGHVESWIEQDMVVVLPVEPADVTEAIRLLKIAGTAGNLTADAQIAAAARRVGGVIHTADSDFGRFPETRWFNPITGAEAR